MLRLYRWLLLLQPRDVRRRYGAEMLALVRMRAAEQRSATFWLREILDVMKTATLARRAAIGWLLVFAAVAHSAYAVSVHPEMMMGIGAILLTMCALVGGAVLLRGMTAGAGGAVGRAAPPSPAPRERADAGGVG